jgi:hypothetical protein
MNDGDWVESCTALVEDQEGNFELLHWFEVRPSLTLASQGGKVSQAA